MPAGQVTEKKKRRKARETDREDSSVKGADNKARPSRVSAEFLPIGPKKSRTPPTRKARRRKRARPKNKHLVRWWGLSSQLQRAPSGTSVHESSKPCEEKPLRKVEPLEHNQIPDTIHPDKTKREKGQHLVQFHQDQKEFRQSNLGDSKSSNQTFLKRTPKTGRTVPRCVNNQDSSEEKTKKKKRATFRAVLADTPPIKTERHPKLT